MAHFAIICVPTSGHIVPLVAVARELAGRGHRTTFLHLAEAAPLLAPYNVDFVPLRRAEADHERFAMALERASSVRGLLGMGALVRDFAESSAIFCETLPDALRELGIDCVVSDWIEPASGLVAHSLCMPYVSIAAALPFNWAPGDASPFLGLPYPTNRWQRYANMGVQWIAERVQRPLHDVIDTYASRWGLPATRRVEAWASGYAQIAQLTASLDFPRTSLVGCFHYCGPLRAAAPPPSPAERRDTGRRRAFATLGSLQGHRADVFEWIADAAEALDLELTIAHGGRLAPSAVARLARRAEVHAHVDYATVLRDSDVAIMHGGLNGVLDALAVGVPLVIAPLAHEQGAIAARVRRAGAGRACRPLARRGRLAATIADVLDDPAYARAAGRIGGDIAAAGGARKAADIIEQVARTKVACLNATAVAAHPDLARHALGAA